MNSFEKIMTIFWLLGPFIYLIERDPADLWLTLISTIFLIRCIKRKDWDWTSQIWFKECLSIYGFLACFHAITGLIHIFISTRFCLDTFSTLCS